MPESVLTAGVVPECGGTRCSSGRTLGRPGGSRAQCFVGRCDKQAEPGAEVLSTRVQGGGAEDDGGRERRGSVRMAEGERSDKIQTGLASAGQPGLPEKRRGRRQSPRPRIPAAAPKRGMRRPGPLLPEATPRAGHVTSLRQWESLDERVKDCGRARRGRREWPGALTGSRRLGEAVLSLPGSPGPAQSRRAARLSTDS